MRTSTLVYLNLALTATIILLYSASDAPDGQGRGGMHTVYISTETPASVDSEAVNRACEAIESDWNGDVTILPSTSDAAAIARTLRQAIALHPDGISMPGHRDDTLILPFVVEARRQGILVTFHDTPLPAAQKRFAGTGAGFIGDRGEHSGFTLAESAVERLGVTGNTRVLVVSTAPEAQPGTRLYGCMEFLQSRAIKPDWQVATPLGDDLEEMMPDPELAKRIGEGALPDLIIWDAGDVNQVATMLDSRGADYNSVSVISLVPVTNPLTESEASFVKFRAYEQPFLTCYFSLAQLHLTRKYGVPGLEVPIGGA